MIDPEDAEDTPDAENPSEDAVEGADPFKSMYEMGQKLMTLATDNGYDPSAGESEDSYDDSTDSAMPTKDKAGAALSFFKGE